MSTDLVQDLMDALGDEWPDTALGWLSYSQRWELVTQVVGVLTTNSHVRRQVLVAAREIERIA